MGLANGVWSGLEGDGLQVGYPLPPGASIGEMAEGQGFAVLMRYVTSRKFIVLCGFEKRWVVQRTGTDRAGERSRVCRRWLARENIVEHILAYS